MGNNACGMELNRDAILNWLRCADPTRLDELWRAADTVRRETVGEAVHLRGLVEIGNYCARQCGYCGLRSGRKGLQRYRMAAEESVACAHEAHAYGYGTVVLQAGEDYGITRDGLASVVALIKAETPLAVTLSLGERSPEDFAAWREAGADRYLLRFETSDPELFALIHPGPQDRPLRNRVELLRTLRILGYEIGSGVMVGIPGQRYETLADDLLLFKELDLDMVGVGPYISHPDTPLGQGGPPRTIAPEDQVPNTELMTYKTVALTRMLCPEANIPSTTALATLNKNTGRELGLQRGANVVMPNLTPAPYREMYEIYPAKVCIHETSGDCRACMRGRIAALGRSVGEGQGGRMRMARTGGGMF